MSGDGKKLSVEVYGPSGTRGRDNLPLASKSCTMNGERHGCGSAALKPEVEGGMLYEIILLLESAVV
jgi:hypothetical protein